MNQRVNKECYFKVVFTLFSYKNIHMHIKQLRTLTGVNFHIEIRPTGYIGNQYPYAVPLWLLQVGVPVRVHLGTLQLPHYTVAPVEEPAAYPHSYANLQLP